MITTAQIELQDGVCATVDAAHLPMLGAGWKLFRTKSGKRYAYRLRRVEVGKWRNEYLHRTVLAMVLGRALRPREEVDHIDGDGLNCRSANLRPATREENMRNCRASRANNTTGYKGVSFDKNAGKYTAKIRANGKQKHIGCFADPAAAALAYDEAARLHHGRFACVNFPESSP